MQLLCRLAICACLLLAIYILAKIKVPTWTCPGWWAFALFMRAFEGEWGGLNRDPISLFLWISSSVCGAAVTVALSFWLYQVSVIICEWIHPIGLGH